MQPAYDEAENPRVVGASGDEVPVAGVTSMEIGAGEESRKRAAKME